MKKLALVMSALSSALLLTACGGGSSSSKPIHSDGSGNANEFTFEVFDLEYDDKAKANGIKRITWKYSDGNVDLKQNNIVNEHTRSGLDNEDNIVLSDKFEGKQRKQDVDVEGNKIILNIVSDTTNQKEYTMIDMQAIDLSGFNSSSYDEKTKIGIYTDLNAYSKIPRDVTFPKGAVCYIPKITYSFNHFMFNKNSVSIYPSMKGWLNAYGKNVVRTESLKSGATNQYDSSVLFHKSDLNELEATYAAVAYKGKIYDADFSRKGTTNNNTDKNKGMVGCDLVNKVAADFLQDQIIQYYK